MFLRPLLTITAVITCALTGCASPQPSYTQQAEELFGISPDERFTVHVRSRQIAEPHKQGLTFYAGGLAENQPRVDFDFVGDAGYINDLATDNVKIDVETTNDNTAAGTFVFDTRTDAWNSPPAEAQSLAYFVQHGLVRLVLYLPIGVEETLRQP